MKKKITLILVLIILVYLVIIIARNALLPIYTDGRRTLESGNKVYERCYDIWSITDKDKLIAKGQSIYDSKIDMLLFPNKIYSVMGDEENNFLWYEPFLSEFGGEMYVSADFRFPLLEDIKPKRIIIGMYWAEKYIENEVYAYSEDEDVIQVFNDIINRTNEYDFNEIDIKVVEEVFDATPSFSLITEQVPGGVYSDAIFQEDDKYYIYSEDVETKYDITYLLYKIIDVGIIENKERNLD